MPLDSSAVGRRGIHGLRFAGLVDGPAQTFITKGMRAGASTVVRWDSGNKSANLTLSNGDRTVVNPATAAAASVFSTLGKTTGKWYTEVVVDGRGPSGVEYWDIALWGGGTARSDTPSSNKGVRLYLTTSFVILIRDDNGPAVSAAIPEASYAGPTVSNTNVIGVAFNADLGYGWFAYQGVWLLGEPMLNLRPMVTGLTGGSYFLGAQCFNDATNPQLSIAATTTYDAPFGYSVW